VSTPKHREAPLRSVAPVACEDRRSLRRPERLSSQCSVRLPPLGDVVPVPMPPRRPDSPPCVLRPQSDCALSMETKATSSRMQACLRRCRLTLSVHPPHSSQYAIDGRNMPSKHPSQRGLPHRLRSDTEADADGPLHLDPLCVLPRELRCCPRSHIPPTHCCRTCALTRSARAVRGFACNFPQEHLGEDATFCRFVAAQRVPLTCRARVARMARPGSWLPS